MRLPFVLALPLLVLGCAGTPPPAPGSPAAAPAAAPGPSADAATAAPATTGLFRLPADVHPRRQRVWIEVLPEQVTFRGRVEIPLVLDAPRAELFVSARGLSFGTGSLQTTGGELPVTAEPDDVRGAARLALPRPAPAGPATLILEYRGRLDARLVGLYRVKTPAGWAAYSQFEAIDARRAFPCFDEPGFKIPWDIEVSIPAALQAFSNTPVAEEKGEGAMKRIRFQTTRPLPSYLLAFAVGDFDVVTPPPLPPNEIRPTPLQLRGVAPRGRGAELAYALKAGGELLVDLERWFGIPYPYPKLDHVAVPDFAYGAMENAGIITYVDDALLVDDAHASQKQRTAVAATMAHEMAHQWFGDLVTMRFWEDLWLNESFATFMTSEVVPAWDPRLGYDQKTLAEAQKAMDNDALSRAHPLRHPLRTEQDIFGFDAKVIYPKGAATLRMFRGYLGRERFRKAIADYLLGHADGNATSEDLVDALSRAEPGAGEAFRSFLIPAGLPRVDARLSCEPGRARLLLSQQRSLPLGSTASAAQRWSIPVCARVEGRSEPACVLLTEATGALELGSRCPRWVHPNAAAEGYYRWTLPAKDLDALDKNLKALSPLERTSLADAILSSAEQGREPAAEALKRARLLARDEEPAVVKRTLEALVHARWYWTTPENRARFEERARALLQPALARWGWTARTGERGQITEFRPELLEDLALEFNDPAVLKRASALGRTYLGVDGAAVPSSVAPDLRALALRAAAHTGNAQVHEAMVNALNATVDRPVRKDVVEGLASFVDPALATRSRALLLAPGLTAHERFELLETQSQTLEQSQACWKWVVENQAPLARLLPENLLSRVPEFQKGATPADAAALRSAFTESTRAAGSGLSYAIDKTGEEIDIRSAVREVQAPSLASALGPGRVSKSVVR
jgi:alanyl aminopeptidase